MKTALPIIICALLAVQALPPASAMADDYFLYAPGRVETPQVPADPADGVLVKKITIRRGDTLSKLSRRYGGRGAYYPQILLFNRIKNPNRIYAGRSLRVPVGGRAVDETAATAPTMTAPRPTAPDAVEQGEGLLYAESVRLFRAGEWARAVVGFNGFLERYPQSHRAADAMLYQAECYARLSGAGR